MEVPDEETVKEWRAAYYTLGDLVDVADTSARGALVAVTDAQDRAHVDLERENG